MKRTLAIALILVLSLGLLAGCGSSTDAEKLDEILTAVQDLRNTVEALSLSTDPAPAESESADTAEGPAESAENADPGFTASEVHIAIQPSAAFIPLYIAREEGWIEEALAEYGVDVTWNDFESGPPMNESLASGDSDFGVIGDVPTVSAIAAGQQNEVIAIAAQAADSYAVLVAADSDIATAADLEGKRIATVIGSTGHNLTQKFLGTAGLSIDDVELINISAGDAATVLANHEVDAVSIWEPSVTRLVDNGVAKIIGEGSDCGLAGTNTIVARKAFASENPLITSVILEQYARAAAAIDTLDDDTWAKVAEDLSLDVDQVKSILPKYNFSVVIEQADIDALNDTIAFLVGIDAISEAYDIGDYANGSYYAN